MGEILDYLGVERSRKAVASADLVIAVIDGVEGPTEADQEILQLASRAPHWILGCSKSDLLPAGSAHMIQVPKDGGPDHCVMFSSVTPGGLASLEDAIADLFPAGSADQTGSLLTDQRQEEAARRAADAIGRAQAALESGLTPDAILTDAEEALDALGELTGRCAREEIVSRIFSRFCVGK